MERFCDFSGRMLLQKRAALDVIYYEAGECMKLLDRGTTQKLVLLLTMRCNPFQLYSWPPNQRAQCKLPWTIECDWNGQWSPGVFLRSFVLYLKCLEQTDVICVLSDPCLLLMPAVCACCPLPARRGVFSCKYISSQCILYSMVYFWWLGSAKYLVCVWGRRWHRSGMDEFL